LTIYDITVGDGAEAKAGDTVTLNYTGYLADGTLFDASANHGGPAQFSLASGQQNSLIPGGQEGVTGMKIGGKRRLIIPPDLAYGSSGAGSLIPPNATITFDFELVSIP
jgi:FKBP-type peptidyl-prolyl cis-trans isomerase FkpA